MGPVFDTNEGGILLKETQVSKRIVRSLAINSPNLVGFARKLASGSNEVLNESSGKKK